MPLSHWDQMAELRASMLDGLAIVARTIIMVNTPQGGHVPEFRPQPRPETAIQRVRRRRHDEIMSDLEQRLAGLTGPLNGSP